MTAKRQKMDKSTLVSIIESHRRDSLGVEDGDLSDERATAMNHYHGRPYGNEVEGRSQVVDRSLMEAVDWAMPAVMKVFTQSGRIAEFDPVGPEDEQLAQQESDYTNQVMMKDNPGFMVLHDAIKDTLLLKNGYVKHWWEVEEKIDESEFTGLTLDAIVMMLRQIEEQGGEYEVTGQESYMSGEPPMMDPMGRPMGPMPVELFDIKLKVTGKHGKVIWMAVPSEEVRVSKKCRGSLQDSPFTEHVTKKTRSDLIEMGMPYEFVYGLASKNETDNNSQSLSRDSVDDESDNTGGSSVGDRSMDEIEFCEAYVKVDYDGDGVAELRKVVTCAGEIPPGEDWNEPISAVPMTGFVAKRVPHRHVGESLDDELADLQEIMTVLKRQLLDNIYLNNNSELVVDSDVVNIRDFMTRTPGGIKRVKGPVGSAVMPLVTKPIIGDILPVIDHFEASKETRSGISRASTGLDPDILQNTTKGAFMENLNRASQKMEMITRLLAETGVKESVLQVHALLNRHQDQARTVQLRGKWVPVNPSEWRERTDLTVRVGLGTGSEEEQRNKLQLLSGLQQQLLQALVGAHPAVYARMYAMFEDIAQTMGFDSPDKYAVAPNSPEHQKMQQEMQQAKQGGDPRAAAEMAKITQQGVLERERMQNQMQVDQNRQEMEAQQHQARLAQEAQLARFEAMLKAHAEQQAAARDIEFQRWKAELDAAVKIQTANISSRAKVQDAATMAATGEIASEVTQDGMHQMPDGSMMAGDMGGMPNGAPMDQQTMPPDGMQP